MTIIPLLLTFAAAIGARGNAIGPKYERSLLIVRVVLNDAGESHFARYGFTKDDARALTWGEPSSGTRYQSIADVIAKSSQGKITFPEKRGKVVTIDLGVSIKKFGSSSSCNEKFLLHFTDTKLQSMGIDVNDYDHVEYNLPDNGWLSACKWGAYSTACGDTNFARARCERPRRRCFTVNRISPSFNFASRQHAGRLHEIGHSLGLPHALQNRETNSWPRDDPVSGGGYTLFSVPHQFLMGVIDPENMITFNGFDMLIKLQDSVRLPGKRQFTALVIPDPHRGSRMVSYRSGRSIYEKNNLIQEGAGAVYVHQIENGAHDAQFKIASSMRKGEVHSIQEVSTLNEGLKYAVIRVCKMWDQSAQVAVTTKGYAHARILCDRGRKRRPRPDLNSAGALTLGRLCARQCGEALGKDQFCGFCGFEASCRKNSEMRYTCQKGLDSSSSKATLRHALPPAATASRRVKSVDSRRCKKTFPPKFEFKPSTFDLGLPTSSPTKEPESTFNFFTWDFDLGLPTSSPTKEPSSTFNLFTWDFDSQGSP